MENLENKNKLNDESNNLQKNQEKYGWLKPGDIIKIEGNEFSVLKVTSCKEEGKKFGLTIKRDVPVYYLDGISPNKKGAYHPKSDIVLIFKNSQEYVLRHELIHVVENYQEKPKSLIILYEKAKSKINEDSFQGNFVTFNFIKNVSEFIADGYSNEAFIKALKKEDLYDDFLKETTYLFKE